MRVGDCWEGEGIIHSKVVSNTACGGKGLGGEVDEGSAIDQELMLIEESLDIRGEEGVAEREGGAADPAARGVMGAVMDGAGLAERNSDAKLACEGVSVGAARAGQSPSVGIGLSVKECTVRQW